MPDAPDVWSRDFDPPAHLGRADPTPVLAETGWALSDLQRLTGGFDHACYRARWIARDVTLRFGYASPDDARREAAILGRAPNGVPAPRVLSAHHGATPALLLTWLEGETLSAALHRFDPADAHRVGAALGRALARIHAVPFDHAGFLGPDGHVAEPLGHVGSAYRDFTHACLDDPRLRARLAPTLRARLHHTLDAHAEHFATLDAARLVHSDFNPKNLIVRRDADGWHLAGVIDWSYAHAGHPLADLGNLLRFAERYPAHFVDALLTAYRDEGGTLPPDWRRAAHLLDLAALVQFLTRPGERPRTVATVRDRLERTLAGLGDTR